MTDVTEDLEPIDRADQATAGIGGIAAVVGGIAALLRVAWVVVMSREPKGLSDLTLYPFFAENIANGNGYLSLGENPTSYYPPGYPFFLGAIQWVLDVVGLGDHLVLVAGLVQALLGGVAVAAIVIAAERIGGRTVAVVAGATMALWPNLIVHSSLMLTETLFIALFSLTLAGLFRAGTDERRLPPTLVVAGVTIGLATLVRPQSALLVLPAVLLAWIVSATDRRRLLMRSVVLVAIPILVVAPWTIRNAVVLDAFVPVSTNTGDNLCMGFNDDATGGFMAAPDCETGEFYVQGIQQEIRRDREARSRATDWALANPGELPGLSVEKLRATYANDRDGLRALESFEQDEFLGDTARSVMGGVFDVYFFAVLVSAGAGAVLLAPGSWRRRRRSPNGLALLAVTLTAMSVPVLSFADTRFKVPVAPCFAILAAIAWVAAARAVNRTAAR